MARSSEEIIHKLKPNLHETPIVESSRRLLERLDHVSYSGNAELKIGAFATRLEILENHPRSREHLLDAITDSLLITEADIPPTYWVQQWQLARDNGRGGAIDDEEEKTYKVEELRDAQRTGIESWLYHLEEFGDTYPLWFKIYAVEGMSTLGTFNKTKGTYNRRSKGTVAPFPRLDITALEKTFDAVSKVYEQEETVGDEALQSLIEGGNFNKIYSKFLLESRAILPTPEHTEDVEGIWREYTEESKQELADAAQGTPWCIAGIHTASDYIKNGSTFYLFHLKDKESGAISPTAAASIRLSYGEVVEVSGLRGGSSQYLEESLVPVVTEKVRTLPGGEWYEQALQDMQRLVDMDRKFSRSEDFTIDELRFLYELDRNIQRMHLVAYDPRPDEFKVQSEHHKQQLAAVYGEEEAKWMVATPMQIMKSIKYLVASGISVDMNRLVERLSAEDVSKHIDTILLYQDELDMDMVIEKLDPIKIDSIDMLPKLIHAGANPNFIIERLKPEAVAFHLPTLMDAGAEIDLAELIECLSSSDMVKHFKTLQAAGVAAKDLVERMRPINILHLYNAYGAERVPVDIHSIMARINPYQAMFELETLAHIARITGADITKDIERIVEVASPRLVDEVLHILQSIGVNKALLDSKLRQLQ